MKEEVRWRREPDVLAWQNPSTYLPGGRVAPKVGKVPGEPVVNFIQCQLPAGGFEYRLKETNVSEILQEPLPC